MVYTSVGTNLDDTKFSPLTIYLNFSENLFEEFKCHRYLGLTRVSFSVNWGLFMPVAMYCRRQSAPEGMLRCPGTQRCYCFCNLVPRVSHLTRLLCLWHEVSRWNAS